MQTQTEDKDAEREEEEDVGDGEGSEHDKTRSVVKVDDLERRDGEIRGGKKRSMS